MPITRDDVEAMRKALAKAERDAEDLRQHSGATVETCVGLARLNKQLEVERDAARAHAHDVAQTALRTGQVLLRNIMTLRQALAFVRYAFADHVCKNRNHVEACMGYYEAHCINALMDTGGVIASDVVMAGGDHSDET